MINEPLHRITDEELSRVQIPNHFEVACCRLSLPWLSAVAVCRGCLPWLSADDVSLPAFGFFVAACLGLQSN